MTGIFFVLGVSGVTLGLVTGYAFWVKIRTLALKAELLEMYAELQHVAIKSGRLSDPAYLFMQERLDAFLLMADAISWPVMVYLVAISRREPRSEMTKPVASIDPQMDTAIKETREKLVNRVSHHIIHRTLTGTIWWLMLRLLPKNMVKEEVSGAVKASATMMIHRNSYSHC
jgi:hypothetical protein